ncbi:Kinesin family member [Nesidiocoris tenuis]|uniref:Kinesin family member n=1 Tax=Nesidiocoris tenuis TaxID=355587 RepID=A0ABN7ANF1_9HEMI|nr:Kinesin family member [Nesidiocoris tenuis]
MKHPKIKKIQIADRSSNVKFYVRFAPADANDRRHLFVRSDKTLLVRSIQDIKRDSPKFTYWQFNTDGIFVDTDQSTIFEKTMAPDLDLVLEGVDVLVWEFGEVGAGKYSTMSGVHSKYMDRGLIPRTLEYLSWRTHEFNSNVKFTVSYVEFFRGQCYDLLSKTPTKRAVAKISPKRILDPKEALDLLFRGEVNRKFEKIRKHCGFAVFSIYIEVVDNSSPDPCVLNSAIHFVESPGIEGFWNLSKSPLCSLFSNLGKFDMDKTSRSLFASKMTQHPTIASSELLKFVEKSFVNGRLILLGFIKPNKDELRLTLSTLRFGSKIARLHIGRLTYNKATLPFQLEHKLENEIDECRKQIAESHLIRSKVYVHNMMTQDQAKFVARLIKSYLDNDSNKVTELNLLSAAEPRLLFEEFRRQYQNEVDDITTNYPLKDLPVLSELKVSLPDVFESIAPSRIGTKIVVDRLQPDDEASQAEGSPKDGADKPIELPAKKSVERKSKSSDGPRTSTARKSLSKQAAGKKPTSKGSKSSQSSKKHEDDKHQEKIDETFLERGRKDRLWLFDQFLLKNQSLAEEKQKVEAALVKARDDRTAGAKQLNDLRALVANTRIRLCELQWKRNLSELSPVKQSPPSPPGEEEISLLSTETESVAKIQQVCQEMISIHSACTEALSNSSAFQNKVDDAFREYCSALYAKTAEPICVRDLDRPIPRETIAPASSLNTPSETNFLKMQATYFHKKLPVDFKYS